MWRESQIIRATSSFPTYTRPFSSDNGRTVVGLKIYIKDNPIYKKLILICIPLYYILHTIWREVKNKRTFQVIFLISSWN